MVTMPSFLRRVERLCEAATDTRSFRVAVLEELRTHIDMCAFVWMDTDPGSGVGVSPVAEIPCLPELATVIRLKYLTCVNRWTAMSTAAPAGLLSTKTEGDRSRSPLWSGLLRNHGIEDVASVVFKDRYGTWGFLDLWRDHGMFGPDEEALLGMIAPTITRTLRRLQALTFGTPVAIEHVDAGPMVFLLDDELQVLSRTTVSEDWLRILLPPGPDGQIIPASVMNVGAQLLAGEQGVDTRPATSRVHLEDGFWVTLRAARLDPGDAASIAVSIQESSASDRIDVFCRAHGLTMREVEIVTALLTRSDTRMVAASLHISEYTVQDHLKSLFRKTGTANRQTLLARALGR